MNKTILLTGATDGIGLELGKKLAKEDHTLLLHGRNSGKLANLEKELRTINPNLKLELFQADLSLLEETKAMAETILQRGENIDVLVNNAGIFVTNQLKNPEGYDVRFMVNTVSPYVLTKMLQPLMNQESRVVNLSSAAQMPVEWAKFQGKGEFSQGDAYAQSKLAIIMWGMELAKEPGGPQIYAINPKSFLGSKMVKEAYGRQGYDLKFGVDILYRASFDQEFAGKSGCYYDNDSESFANPHPFAENEQERKNLMTHLAKFL